MITTRLCSWFLVAALAWTLLASAPLTAGAAAAPSSEVGGASKRRFALVASSNDGGKARARLRFADSDGKAIADVLAHLGGLRSQDMLLVPGATRASLEAAFARLRQSIAQAAGGRMQRELFFYYSGHSDEEGLLLGSERVGYRELRQWIHDLGADVRIVVLDSCASGALIRIRGGSKRPSFLDDVSTDARGHAFLTASSADEAAQESDRIGAAFFTHYLVSGLRGAADRNHNGRVTLGEAYDFAYQETLQRTERTAAGAQHPEYDFQLAGKGDFVLTSLGEANAGLVLEENIAGRVYVRDPAGRLLVELRKEPLYPVELGLGPGSYRVLLDADGVPYEAQVALTEGKTVRLGKGGFQRAAPPLVAAVRGSGPAPGAPGGPDVGVAAVAAPAATASLPYRRVPFDLSLAPGYRLVARDNERTVHNFVIGLVGHSQELQGVQLSLAGNVVDERMNGVQITPGFNMSTGSAQWVQIGGVNMVGGSFKGVQEAWLSNIVKNDLTGFQASMANVVGGKTRGMQAGIVNASYQEMQGFQAGVVNITGSLRGMEAGVVNVAGQDSRMAQFGVANLTGGNSMGLQMGVVNVTRLLTGSQIGVVNVGDKVKGVQLGVINVARSVDGASVGLLNFVGDGYHTLSLYSSDIAPSNIAFKLGSKYVYGLAGFGLDRTDDKHWLFVPQAGIGAHIPFTERLFMDADIINAHYGTRDNWSEDSNLSTLRVAIGWQLARNLAVTVGPTLSFEVRPPTDPNRPGGFSRDLEKRWLEGDRELRLFPGFVAGMQL